MDQATIINMAVGELGDLSTLKRMTAFTRAGCGSSTALNVAFDFYQPSKEQMLAAMDWSRSRRVKSLGAEIATDGLLSDKWSYRYARPADCLILRKVIDSSGNEYKWEEVDEGGSEYIYCDVADALIRYAFDVSEARYNVGMAQLHALYLAEHIAPTVVGDNAKALLIVQKLQARAERLCLELGSKEGYVENEDGGEKTLLVDYY